MKKKRRHFTPEEKVAIVRRHLVDKVLVSELCEELGLRPTVFYRWQKELDVLAGRQREIHAERGRKLEAARQQRQSRRQQAV